MGNNQLPTILKNRSDFQNIKDNGRRVYPCSWMIVNFAPSSSGETRYGWTISRFVGNAVARNRFKRWCREFIRQNAKMLQAAHLDVNFVFRKKHKEFYKDLDRDAFNECLKNAVVSLQKKAAW